MLKKTSKNSTFGPFGAILGVTLFKKMTMSRTTSHGFLTLFQNLKKTIHEVLERHILSIIDALNFGN